MDKIKKYLTFLMFPLFLLMMFFPAGEAHAATDITNKVILKNLKLTIASTGDESTGYHGENDTTVALKYSGEFSFPNVTANEIKEGDFFIVEAPSNLSLEDRTLKLEDKISGKIIGNVRVESAKHRLVFTFNSEVEDKQNIRGDFFASAKETVTKEDKIVTYVLPGGKTQIITFKTLKTKQAPVEGEVIYKGGWNHGSLAKAGYYVRINRSQQDLKNKTVEITDDISLGAFASYMDGSFALNEAEFDTTNTNFANLKRKIKPYKITTDPEEYKKDSDNTALLTLTNGKRSFKLLMPTNMGKKSFFLEYATTSPADTSEIKNSAQFLIDNEPQLTWKKWGDKINTSKESIVTLKTVKAAGASVTADIAGKIKITKFDEADATVKLAGVVFEIVNKNNSSETYTVTTDENGVALSPALSDGQYIVKEKTPKAGYVANSQEFEVEMKQGKGVPLNISNKRKTVDFEATKTWVGGKSTDYKKAKLGLYVHKEGQTIADSKPVSGSYTPEVTESNGVYTYKWKNQLPKYDVDGTKLIYSVRELQDTTELPLKEGEKVASGDHNYVVSYNADKTQVTNTYEVPKTKVTANKVWTGGRDSVRPSLFFKLYRTLEGGTAEAVTNADQKEVPKTDGTVEWSDLPATDQNGVTYTYSVKEVDKDGNLVTTVDGYTSEQTAGLTVTNKYAVKLTSASLEVTKKLTGRELKADEFEFVLKNDADGSELQKVKNTADGKVTFAPIEYTKSGTYNYTIVETNAGKTVDGVTYDNLEVKVTVEVTDDGEGKLHANVTYPEDKEFNNSYGTSKAKAALEVTKKLTGRELKADEFEFTLTDQDGNVKETVKNDEDGNVKFSELEFDKAGTYTYNIAEKAGTATGIQYDTKTITATVTVADNGKGVLEATVAYDGEKVFENTYTPAGATSVTLGAKKVLEGKNLEAGKYSFELKKEDGSVVETVTNAADGTVTFSPISYDESQVGTHKYTISEVAGSETGITYDKTVQEVEVTVEKVSATELKATVSKEAKDLVFTNKYTPAGATTVTLGAKKVLEGKKLEAGKYSFVLKKEDGSVVETVTNAADGTVTFSPISYDESQVGTHKYTISEVAGSEAGITYDKTVQEVEVTVEKVSATELKATASKEAKDLVFTNKYTPAGATSVTLGAKKVLEGKDLEAGKYSFVLKEGDKELETVTNAADGTVTFSPISYDESQVGTHKYTISEVVGSEAGITYDKTVQEVEVTVEKVSATELKATASKEAKDLVFTNKYTPAKTSVSVKKTWDDKDNQDGKRPSSVTVKLLADGQDTGKTLELNAANGWAGSFTDLDADKGGIPIQYTVVEVTVPGYTSEVTGDAASGFTITNSYSPETVDIKATKNWDDANNQDGKRPTKITINLLADGQKVDSKEIQAAPDGTWSVEFTKLAKYKDGKEIKYTVTEEAVAEYDSYIKDFTITNKYTPKAIDYKVTKVWNDANDQDGKRPESVTVQLYKKVGDADPVAVEGKKLTLTAKDKTDANTWVASFTNLPQFEAGKEITYSIKEVDVPAGYESSVTGQVVTNTHNPDTVILSGTKVWDDNNNQDGKRTTSVKVQILNGDKVVQEIEVSEKTGWKFESKKLPKYENGKEIKYKVKEVVVAEYKSVVTDHEDGKYTITNKHTPEKTTVKGKKIWDDANNQDGKRPDSITVRLLANGKETDKEATASEASGWTYEFTDLDRYQDGGKEIVYTVKEAYVPKGYTSEVIGTNIVNHHKPKDPEPNKPQDPEPNNPKDPEPNKPGKPGQKPQLPNTGEKASNVAVVAGLALMVVTGGLYFVSRKNK
ncbi:Cna B-type domain-containing protein [Streptococcus sp. 517s]